MNRPSERRLRNAKKTWRKKKKRKKEKEEEEKQKQKQKERRITYTKSASQVGNRKVTFSRG
jgi:hypothetical protein